MQQSYIYYLLRGLRLSTLCFSLFGGCCATSLDLGGFELPAKTHGRACDELGHTQTLFAGGLRDEGNFLLGGQDPNPEHEPPPNFGP